MVWQFADAFYRVPQLLQLGPNSRRVHFIGGERIVAVRIHLPLPLELDVLGFVLWQRGSIGWWWWLWGTFRYVVINCFVALIVFFVSHHDRVHLRQHFSGVKEGLNDPFSM